MSGVRSVLSAAAADEAAIVALMKTAPYPIVTIGEGGAVQWANDAARALLDCGRKREWSDVLPPKLGERMRLCLQSGELLDFCEANSNYGWRLVPAAPPHRAAALIGRPIETEAGLQKSRHFTSIGELAAGIAHEINTPMQYIGDNVAFVANAFASLRRFAEVVFKTVPGLKQGGAAESAGAIEAVIDKEEIAYLLEETGAALEQTREGVARVVGIARAIKEFSHFSVHEKTQADLNRAIETTITIARNELKYVAEVRTELAALPSVPCVLGQIHQVLLHLLLNAAHAVGDRVNRSVGEHGEIRIRTRAEADAVVIEVEDSGTGIPEHVRGRIFERFFTTKPRGIGSGEGLAFARHVVEEVHGGTLGFETEMGKGTTFIVRLPIAPPAER